MESMKVTSVCIQSVVGDIKGNKSRIIESIESSSAEESDIILFPELSLTGYSMPSSRGYPLSIDSPDVGEIVDSACDNSCIVSFGMVDDAQHISQVITENGRIVGTYDKTHLGDRESKVMRPGDSLDVIHTSKCNLGVQICWESHFPDITRTYAMRGADIILMPHASPLSGQRRKAVWDRIVPARCNDNVVFAMLCNSSGGNGCGSVFGGGASIVDPRGNIIGEDYSPEGSVTVEIDPEEMEMIRSENGRSMRDTYFLNRRRPELYEF
jgi:predicted amidohydrolase